MPNILQEAMRLSEHQKARLLKARSKYLMEVGHLLEERRRLQGILKVFFRRFRTSFWYPLAIGSKA